jgi:hypothetical protein
VDTLLLHTKQYAQHVATRVISELDIDCTFLVPPDHHSHDQSLAQLDVTETDAVAASAQRYRAEKALHGATDVLAQHPCIDEDYDPSATPAHTLPDELLWQIFSLLDSETLLTAVPRVCRRWRFVSGNTEGVRLDLAFLGDRPLAGLRVHASSATGVEMASGLARRFRSVVHVSFFCILVESSVIVL